LAQGSRGLMGEDYYALLGVARDASAEQIKRGYWTEAVRHHPDKNPGNTHAAAERFKKISEAYEVLSDEQKRAVYMRTGATARRCFRPAPRASGAAASLVRVHALSKAAEDRAARFRARAGPSDVAAAAVAGEAVQIPLAA